MLLRSWRQQSYAIMNQLAYPKTTTWDFETHNILLLAVSLWHIESGHKTAVAVRPRSTEFHMV